MIFDLIIWFILYFRPDKSTNNEPVRPVIIRMGKENVPPPKNGKRSSQIPTKTLTTESSEALENNESSEDTDTTETIAEPKKKYNI